MKLFAISNILIYKIYYYYYYKKPNKIIINISKNIYYNNIFYDKYNI